MNKILLINPYIYDFACYDLWKKPLGFLYIASILKDCGCNVTLIDCMDRFHPDIKEKYQKLSERITTLKEMNKESLQWEFPVIRSILCPFSIVILAILFAIGGILALMSYIPPIYEFFEKIFLPLFYTVITITAFLCEPIFGDG